MNVTHYIIASAIAASSVGAIVSVSSAYATSNHSTACVKVTDVQAVGTKNTVGETNSRFTLNGRTLTATVEVKTDKKCTVTLASWEAPNATDGKPYDKQKLYKHTTKTFGKGKHQISVQLPDCYYQADLVTGSTPTDPNGGPMYGEARMMGSLHGGTKSCDKPVTPPVKEDPKPEVKPETPTTGVGGATDTAEELPEVLPSTGVADSASMLALGAASVAGGFQYIRAYRNRK